MDSELETKEKTYFKKNSVINCGKCCCEHDETWELTTGFGNLEVLVGFWGSKSN